MNKLKRIFLRDNAGEHYPYPVASLERSPTYNTEYIRADLLDQKVQEVDREALASLMHDIWSYWMKYLFSRCHNIMGDVYIPKGAAACWLGQMNTPYSELSEKEKESDREQADKLLAALAKPAPVDACPVCGCTEWITTSLYGTECIHCLHKKWTPVIPSKSRLDELIETCGLLIDKADYRTRMLYVWPRLCDALKNIKNEFHPKPGEE